MAYNNGAHREMNSQLHLKGGGQAITLAGAVTLNEFSAQMLALDCDGAERIVTLPETGSHEGLFFEFYNSSSGSYNLVIKDSAAATVATIAKGQTQKVYCTGAAWILVASLPATSADFASSTIAESTPGAGTTITGAATGSASFTEKVAGTINHATNNFRAMWAKASAITTARTAGTVAAYVAELVGFATDTSGATYVGFDGIAPTANGGSAVYVWGRVAAGFAKLLDLTGVATGEAIIALKDNLAVALAIKEATTSYLTFVTTNAAEAINAGVRLTTTDGVASGIARVVGGKVYCSVAASTAITGATETETLFDSQISLPADTLKAGTVVRVRGQGIYTATTGSETHSIILKIGSVAVCTLAAVDPANSDLFYFEADIVCRDAGGTGHIVAAGTALAQAATAVGTAKPFFLASTAIDTTGANIVGIAIDRQASATDSDSARLDLLVVEVIG